VRLDGIPWQEVSPVEWRKRIAYLHQKAVLFHGTIRENLTKAFTFRSRSHQEVDLTWAEQTLSRLLLPQDILERDAATVSVGEAARVALVRALMGNPRVLLPDEVSAALDAETRDAVVTLLKEWVGNEDSGIVGVIHDDAVMDLLPGKVVRL
jgi:putative ABC transport system ATP-binding protein